MTSPAAAFHETQDTVLRGSAALTAALGLVAARVLTDVPPGQKPSYVVIGADQVLIENHDCAAEAEIFSTVDVWTRTNPLDKGAMARAAGAIIIDLLNAQLTVAGWMVDEWELTSERYVTDPDQSTHGILEFHYLLTQQVI